MTKQLLWPLPSFHQRALFFFSLSYFFFLKFSVCVYVSVKGQFAEIRCPVPHGPRGIDFRISLCSSCQIISPVHFFFFFGLQMPILFSFSFLLFKLLLCMNLSFLAFSFVIYSGKSRLNRLRI